MSDVTVTGNIGEPGLKFTPSGKAVLEFSLAENHRKKDQQGEWGDDGTTWRRVSIWEKKAEALADVLKKGDRVIVTGQERIREWEGKDGNKGQSLELNARDVGIIPKSQSSGPAPQAQQAQQSQQSWGGSAQETAGWGSPANQGESNVAPF